MWFFRSVASTSEAQSSDSSTFIDASGLSITAMGSMGNMRGGGIKSEATASEEGIIQSFGENMSQMQSFGQSGGTDTSSVMPSMPREEADKAQSDNESLATETVRVA